MMITKRCAVCGRFRAYDEDDEYCIGCGHEGLSPSARAAARSTTRSPSRATSTARAAAACCAGATSELAE